MHGVQRPFRLLLRLTAAAASAGGAAAGDCSPKADIYRLVLQQGEEDLIVNGTPAAAYSSVEDVSSSLPRSCRPWATSDSCCRRGFFELVNRSWDSEARQFEVIREMYMKTIPDVVSKAAKDEILALVEGVGLLVKNYIDDCEDKVRLHLAATTCELCDPNVSAFISMRRTMHVDDASCQEVWKQCFSAPSLLRSAKPVLATAAYKLSAINSQSRAFTHASKYIRSAMNKMEAGAKRIDFYSTRDGFCQKLAEEGYGYRPKAWGDVKLLDPGILLDEELDEGRRSPPVQLLPVPSTPTKIMEPARTSPRACIHGWLRGIGECVCQPCWTGPSCETRAKRGPMILQPYSPLVAKDSSGSQQLLSVVGCQLPVDLTSQLARIKLLWVREPSSGGGAGEAGAEDPCQTEDWPEGHPDGRFQEFPRHVPVTATQSRLEYLIQVPQGSEGLYAVCYCFGPECLRDVRSWMLTGHVKVLRTPLLQKQQEVIQEMSGASFAPSIPQAGRACDDQWMYGSMETVEYEIRKSQVDFRCRNGFSDFEGPASLTCTDGEWYPSPAEPDLSRGPASLQERQPWDQQLPRCRWGHRGCDAPEGSERVEGGSCTVQDGMATYRCNAGSVMLVDTAGLELKPGNAVRRRADGLFGRVKSVVSNASCRVAWTSEPSPPLQRADARDEKESDIQVSAIDFVDEDSSFTSMCSANGTWIPGAAVRCVGPDAGEEESTHIQDDRAKEGVLPVRPRQYFPCHGTFVVPAAGHQRSGQQSQKKAARVNASDLSSAQPVPKQAGALSFAQLASEEASSLQEALPAPAAAPAASAPGAAGGRRWLPPARFQEQGAELGIRQWPIFFSKDAARSFAIDRCYTSWDCEPGGGVPADAAAAPGRLPRAARPRVLLPTVLHVLCALIAVAAVCIMVVIGQSRCKHGGAAALRGLFDKRGG